MHRKAALACLLLFLAPVFPAADGATEISTFAGGETALDLVLSLPELRQVAEFEVPNPCIPLSASLNISTDPDRAPDAPALDFGEDGTVEWAFNGTGFGAFGRQGVLNDGRQGFEYPVEGDFGYNAGLLLPKGASIRSATLNLTGAPGDPAMASAPGGPLDLKAGETASPGGPAVPAGASGVNATVRLSGAVATTKDAECTAWSNFKVFGWQGAQYQSLAQTFTSSGACNLTGVEIYINSIVGSPGPVYIELRATDGSGKPSAALSAVQMIAQGAVTAPGWNAVSFNPPIDLEAASKYAVVAYAKDASATGTNEYLWYGSALEDPYSGGTLWIYTSDAAATGTPAQSALMDQAFRTIVRRPLTAPEMNQVRVNGASPDSTDGKGGYFYEFADPAYDAGSWPISIKNQNAFNLTSLGHAASTWYRPRVLDVAVGVNGRTADWTQAGPLEGTVSADIMAGLARELPGATAAPDAFGNLMCGLNLTFSASGEGRLRMSGLAIRYDLSATVGGLPDALAQYLEGRPEGPVAVRVLVRASSPGAVRLGALSVSVDAAPALAGPIPSTLSIPEDGQNDSLLDLSAYLGDDAGCTYNCLPAETANASNVEFTVDGAMLGARAVKPDWHGTVQLSVEAVDGRGQKTVSNNFLFTVAAVNDAPVIAGVPPARAETGRDYQYQVAATDVDGDPLTFALEGAPAGMMVNATGLVSWRPGGADLGLTFNITLTVSDGRLSATQTFSVTTFSGNRPPVLGAVADAAVTAGTPFSLQLSASDPDGDGLDFTLLEAPAGMFVNRTGMITWTGTKAGNHTVRARVSDGVASAESTFVLRAATPPPPVITSAPPSNAAQGKPFSYQLAVDKPGQAGNLTYLLISGPAGMTVSKTGLVAWTPAKGQSGTFHVILRVKAGNESAVQEFDLKVAAASETAKGDDTPLLLAAAAVLAVIVSATVVLALRKKGKGGGAG